MYRVDKMTSEVIQSHQVIECLLLYYIIELFNIVSSESAADGLGL
jgi:hypothetical protein